VGQPADRVGRKQPVYGHPHGDADSLASRAGGPLMALRRLEIEESRHIANYGTQLKDLGDEGSIAILEHVIEDEKTITANWAPAARPHPRLQGGKQMVDAKSMLEELLAKRNQGKSQAGSWIGDAIYGVNDGLGAIFGIVSGVSGATAGNGKYVLLAGLAGMIASALSMGSGAYLAAKSEREIYEAEVEREREAIQMNPSKRASCSRSTTRSKDCPRRIPSMLSSISPPTGAAAECLAAERLNTSEEGLKVPWVSATSGALSTAVGAMIPVIPFFFMTGTPAVITAAVISWQRISPSAQPSRSSQCAPGGPAALK
jgi:VIT1/CCC1 family predicted Fe2+/Mn2+ transporter